MKPTFYILFFISITGCANEKSNNQNESTTPLALIEEAGDYEVDILSRSKYTGDIIHRLYEEALGRDPELKEIDDRIIGVDRISNDSIAAYFDYVSKNENYWRTLEKYLSNISDSVLRENSKNLFTALKKDYHTSIVSHELGIKIIDELQVELKDQSLLLKLLITAPMMKNYQENELPDIATLDEMIRQLQVLVNEVKKFPKNQQ